MEMNLDVNNIPNRNNCMEMKNNILRSFTLFIFFTVIGSKIHDSFQDTFKRIVGDSRPVK